MVQCSKLRLGRVANSTGNLGFVCLQQAIQLATLQQQQHCNKKHILLYFVVKGIKVSHIKYIKAWIYYQRIRCFSFLCESLYWLDHFCFNVGIKSIALAADVSKPEDVQRVVDAITERWGTVHIACNNAGVNMNSASEDTTLEEWDKTFNVNLRGLFLCCQVSVKGCTGLFWKWAIVL